MHYVSCIRRYNALMNKVIWISGVTVSTRAKALVLTVTQLMHINLFISALYLRMHSTRALSYTYPSNGSKQILETHTAYCTGTQYTR